MSVPVLLNFLNKFGKSNKFRGLQSILSLFRNKFNKYNDSGTQMLDLNYHMTLNNFKIMFFARTR